MINNKEEYLKAETNLHIFNKKIADFDETLLINKGYPLWIIRSQKDFLFSNQKELKFDIEQYKIKNPSIKFSDKDGSKPNKSNQANRKKNKKKVNRYQQRKIKASIFSSDNL